MKTLIFVDTNIYLDFYRFPGSQSNLDLLYSLIDNAGKIISTCQVEAEYLKNRQREVREAIGRLSELQKAKYQIPNIFQESELEEDYLKYSKSLKTAIEEMKELFRKMLDNPHGHDEVFKGVMALHKSKSDSILERASEKYAVICNQAESRFVRGDPPRKRDDTSIGDAINWEWILDCASRTKSNVIIVSRDSDYGELVDGSFYLNDYLKAEFVDRVGSEYQIILTNNLAKAFKIAGLKVLKQNVLPDDESIVRRNIAAGFDMLCTAILQTMIEEKQPVSTIQNYYDAIVSIIPEFFPYDLYVFIGSDGKKEARLIKTEYPTRLLVMF